MAESPKSKITKASGKSSGHSAVSRRAELRKNLRPSGTGWRQSLRRSEALSSLPSVIMFLVIASALTAWTREQPLIAPGRLMTQSSIVRTEFRIENTAAIEDKIRTARQNTPRVYNAASSFFNDLDSSLLRLPTALADAQTLDDVAPEIRAAFGLTDAQLVALRTQAVAGDASQQWRTHVEALIEQLYATPLLDNETYQLEQTNGSRQWIKLHVPDHDPAQLLKGNAVNLASAQLASTLRQVVLKAGFEDPVASMIAGSLSRDPKPTFVFDSQATSAAQDAAAAAVKPEYITHPVGEVIFSRGDRLTPDARALYLAERAARAQHASALSRWAPRLAVFIETLFITIGLSLCVVAFNRRIRKNPLRVFSISVLLLGGLALSSTIALSNPFLLLVAAAAPATFITAILVIAYDRPTALSLGTLHAVLTMIALNAPTTSLIPAIAGVFAAAWTLDAVRHRNDLVRAGVITGAALALGVVAADLLNQPLAPGWTHDLLIDASWAMGAGVAIGVLTLAMLPTIERVFGVITGMTLIELRDPKQPLLRELQQRAPGTYNHSLAVANIAETAAEAIGARSLHLYVGALYHDIGKMNKPDYFVENQTGGFNRHDKLTPAMSLLVIVGHVKDGAELAREYNLPRSLHHYIESHHGTTVVEYFYHEAQKQADESHAVAPKDTEYRYPGPKPRTKEAAILMLSDTVESATRALKEPAPARIETLVRSIARKRLEDDQFDECDLTLRELQTIENSIIKSVTSIYHSRIAYPTDAKDEDKPAAADAPSPAKTTSFEKTISHSA